MVGRRSARVAHAHSRRLSFIRKSTGEILFIDVGQIAIAARDACMYP